MAREGYYATNLNRDLTNSKGLPVISLDLDSVRAYQWELTFYPPENVEVPQTFAKPLTLAAKKVSGLSFEVETIEVNRVNSKVFYPGRPNPGELTVTFDHLIKSKTAFQLYKYFQSVYDPVTGEFTSSFLQSPTGFKSNVDLVELDGKGNPFDVVKLLGVFPIKFAKADKDYGNNEFDTIDVSFKYDILVQKGSPK